MCSSLTNLLGEDSLSSVMNEFYLAAPGSSEDVSYGDDYGQALGSQSAYDAPHSYCMSSSPLITSKTEFLLVFSSESLLPIPISLLHFAHFHT